MRCVDVIQELAAPSDTQDAAAMADHLRHCSSCAAFADHSARLDRLWEATRPSEPAPEVWDNLWSQLAHSLEESSSQEVASSPAFRNGSTSPSVLNFDVNPPERSPALSFRSWLRAGISVVGLSRVAAAFLIAGLTWWFLLPAKKSLPSVDIEAGQFMVVIVADPNSPSVVDRTPKGMTASADREYVDWYGDERFFDWPQVFNEVEFLAKPQVAMQGVTP
jgi:hypothetical protein